MSRNSLVLLVFTLVLSAIGGLLLLAPPQAEGERQVSLPAFDLQAHRMARGLYPENSLPGAAGSLELGVTTLEMDLAVTGDGVVVVYHNRRLVAARTRGPDGVWLAEPEPLLIDLTLDELQEYDIGRLHPESSAARRFPEQRAMDQVRIPSLAQVFELAERQSGGRIRYNLETKLSPLAPEESLEPEAFIEAVAQEVERAGVATRVTLQSFDWRTLRATQARLPEVATMFLTAEIPQFDTLQRGQPGISPWLAGLDLDERQISVPEAVMLMGGDLWGANFKTLRPSDVEEAHRLGLKVVVFTVNEEAEMASLIDLGVDGVMTDFPNRLRRVMADKEMDLPPPFPAE